MSKSYKLLFFLSIFFCSLLLAINVKTYILIFLVAFAIFFFYFRYSLIESVFLMFVISLPFEKNLREWTYAITSPLFLDIPGSGYTYFFGVNLKIVFGLFLFLLLLKNKNKIKISFQEDWPLLFLFAIACLNTGYNFSVTSILGLIRFWLSTLIYFSAKIFFKSRPNLYPIFISALFIFSVFIGLNQFVHQKPLGKFIELTPDFSYDTGYTTTDGKVQYRVAGYISHPVYFGSFISILFPIFITYALFNISLPFAFPITLLGIVVMLGTNSRSVWLTILTTFILLYSPLKNKYQNTIKNFPYKKISIIIFILLILTTTITRLESVTKLFTQNGNASIRLELIWQSLIIISQHPFGTGLNQFTPNLISQPVPKSLYGFIVPVHNTILIITSELGILAGSLFIFFIIKSIFFRKVNLTYNFVTYGAIIGAITFLISSQFHPLFNLDPTFDLFMLTLGYINSQCQYSKT